MNSEARYEVILSEKTFYIQTYLYVNLPNLHTQFSFDAIHCNIQGVPKKNGVQLQISIIQR